MVHSIQDVRHVVYSLVLVFRTMAHFNTLIKTNIHPSPLEVAIAHNTEYILELIYYPPADLVYFVAFLHTLVCPFTVTKFVLSTVPPGYPYPIRQSDGCLYLGYFGHRVVSQSAQSIIPSETSVKSREKLACATTCYSATSRICDPRGHRGVGGGGGGCFADAMISGANIFPESS